MAVLHRMDAESTVVVKRRGIIDMLLTRQEGSHVRSSALQDYAAGSLTMRVEDLDAPRFSIEPPDDLGRVVCGHVKKLGSFLYLRLPIPAADFVPGMGNLSMYFTSTKLLSPHHAEASFEGIHFRSFIKTSSSGIMNIHADPTPLGDWELDYKSFIRIRQPTDWPIYATINPFETIVYPNVERSNSDSLSWFCLASAVRKSSNGEEKLGFPDEMWDKLGELPQSNEKLLRSAYFKRAEILGNEWAEEVALRIARREHHSSNVTT